MWHSPIASFLVLLLTLGLGAGGGGGGGSGAAIGGDDNCSTGASTGAGANCDGGAALLLPSFVVLVPTIGDGGCEPSCSVSLTSSKLKSPNRIRSSSSLPAIVVKPANRAERGVVSSDSRV